VIVVAVRVCKIESVDGSNISAYYVHECEAINRTGLRSRRFVFTGHLNGTVQVRLGCGEMGNRSDQSLLYQPTDTIPFFYGWKILYFAYH